MNVDLSPRDSSNGVLNVFTVVNVWLRFVIWEPPIGSPLTTRVTVVSPAANPRLPIDPCTEFYQMSAWCFHNSAGPDPATLLRRKIDMVH